MNTLEGKVVVITGGAHGLGYAMAEALKKSGATVFVSDQNNE